MGSCEACLANVMEEDYTLRVDLATLQGEYVQVGDDLIENLKVTDCGVVKTGGVEEKNFAGGECGNIEGGLSSA